MKKSRKYAAALLITSIIITGSAFSTLLTTASEYTSEEILLPAEKENVIISSDIVSNKMTEAQLALETFIKENDLSSLAIPETLPEKTMEALEKLCDERLYEISFYYYDIETGFTMSYNEDRVFKSASCIKMPYMCYILHLIDEGDMSLDDKIALTAADLRQGTSTIRDEGFAVGTEFTIKQLIEYLMIGSDNTAFAMFCRVQSVWKFASWANSNYGTKFNVAINREKVGQNSMTAKSTARMLRLIYEKAQDGEENYLWLIELLKQANKNTFVKYGIADTSYGIWDSDYRLDVEVAHKYGMDVHASNDAALVLYEDRPYILVILTDWIGYPSDNLWWTEGDMRTVSYYIFQLHKYIIKSGQS
ncbi:MAG: hypothetical protein A2Y17_03950 [Clostridiales bacterium GWF2_38_85]|nr:MAG: hypothetical protein A2Y17_03950 [Clostridiales bacterium GWF2_38_85]HBL83949.1 hypothetical protein [Clostridiales bacterium]